MRIKILFFMMVISSTSILKAQLYETLEKNSADLFIALSDEDQSYENKIEILRSTLFTDVSADEQEKTYLTTATEFDDLKNHFLEFEKELRNISVDSALVLFNYWYLHFSNTFYNYAEEKFFSSEKTKIILCGTSMACYCTLEMAKNQTVDLLNFIRANDEIYDFVNAPLCRWIIDSFEHNELQIEYLTLFSPSVIIFDANNEVRHKIEYEADFNDKLIEFFNINHKVGESKNDFNKSSRSRMLEMPDS